MKTGFLGFGHLARAIDSGIKAKSLMPSRNIYVCAKSAETKALAEGLSHTVCGDATELFGKCDLVILAIKPKVFREMKDVLSSLDTAGKRVISVMAAVSEEELSSVFSCPVMRVMPTVAVTKACDVIGYFTRGGFDDVISALKTLGDAIELDEGMLDRLTVASSCGLGFAAHMLELYKAECERLGFSGEESALIVKRIFAYAADCGDFSGLEELVATKGGVTEAGISEMDSAQREALRAAFDVSVSRAVPKK